MTTESSIQAAPKKVGVSLIRHLNVAKAQTQSINGSVGQEIKDAVENKHLHSGALKMIAKLARLDEIKRNDFLASFDLYRIYAMESNFFGEEHVGDLMDDAESVAVATGAAVALGDVAGENVRKLRGGIKKTSKIVDDDPLSGDSVKESYAQ